MLSFTRIYAVAVAIILIIGETWVVLTTNKYWPLSLDDYIACGALLVAAYSIKRIQQAPWLMAIWMFMFGNIYAMLFNRLDPISGTGERVTLLIGLLVFIAVGIVSSTHCWRQSNLLRSSANA